MIRPRPHMIETNPWWLPAQKGLMPSMFKALAIRAPEQYAEKRALTTLPLPPVMGVPPITIPRQWPAVPYRNRWWAGQLPPGPGAKMAAKPSKNQLRAKKA